MANPVIAGSKRVAALTGFMLALVVVAGSAGLYRLDAESFRDDAQALLLLQRFDRYLADNEPAHEALPLRLVARQALERDHPEIYQRMIANQEILFDHLRQGMNGSEPFECEQLRERWVEGKFGAQQLEIEPHVVRAGDVLPFALVSVSTPWLDRGPERDSQNRQAQRADTQNIGSQGQQAQRVQQVQQPPGIVPRGRDLEERGTVVRLLDTAALALRPVVFRVAEHIALEPLGLPPCEPPRDATLQQRLAPPAGVKVFDGARLAGSTVKVALTSRQSQSAQQQPVVMTSEIEIKADVVRLEGPSTAQLMADFGGTDWARTGADLVLLGTRPDALDRLRRDYGFLPIDYAVSTAGAALVQGYSGANLFGLRVTARRLGLAVTIAAIALAGTLAAEAAAAAVNRRRLSDLAPEGIRALIAAWIVPRLIVWSLVPAGAILLAAPPAPAWSAAAAAAAGLGAAASLLAAVADRRGAPATLMGDRAADDDDSSDDDDRSAGGTAAPPKAAR